MVLIRYDGAVQVWVRLLLLTLLGGLGHGVGHAQEVGAPTAALPVVLWLLQESDAELLLRVQGQTTDLPVLLQAQPSDGNARTSATRLQQAADRAKAGVVLVYREPTPRGGHRLRLLHRDRVLTRDLGDRPSLGAAPLHASAALEGAAVIVRSAVKALLAGELLGDSIDAVLIGGDGDAGSSARSAGAVESTALRGYFASLAWQVSVDGNSPQAAHGLAVSAGWTTDRWLLRGIVSLGIPALLQDDRSTLALSRHQLGLGGAWVPWSGARARLQLGLAVSLCAFLRSTQDVDPLYEATPPHLLPALCVSPQLGLWLRPVARLPLFAELTLGADVLWGQPRLGYVEGATFVERGALWPVQPALSLAVLWVAQKRSGSAPAQAVVSSAAPSAVVRRNEIGGRSVAAVGGTRDD